MVRLSMDFILNTWDACITHNFWRFTLRKFQKCSVFTDLLLSEKCQKHFGLDSFDRVINAQEVYHIDLLLYRYVCAEYCEESIFSVLFHENKN